MKSGTDPRHLNREHALKSLFQYTYTESVGTQELADKVINAVKLEGIFYDVTNKPPGTIEWE